MNHPSPSHPSPEDAPPGPPPRPPPPLDYAGPRAAVPPTNGAAGGWAVVKFAAGMAAAVMADCAALAADKRTPYLLIWAAWVLPASLLFPRQARMFGAGWLTMSALAYLTLRPFCGPRW